MRDVEGAKTPRVVGVRGPEFISYPDGPHVAGLLNGVIFMLLRNAAVFSVILPLGAAPGAEASTFSTVKSVSCTTASGAFSYDITFEEEGSASCNTGVSSAEADSDGRTIRVKASAGDALGSNGRTAWGGGFVNVTESLLATPTNTVLNGTNMFFEFTYLVDGTFSGFGNLLLSAENATTGSDASGRWSGTVPGGDAPLAFDISRDSVAQIG
jgi:hypothetical protein